MVEVESRRVTSWPENSPMDVNMQRRHHSLIDTASCWLQACSLIVSLGASGCYPHAGRPTDYSEGELVERATQACARGDREAWVALVKRLHTNYPDNEQGARGVSLIERDRPCDLFSTSFETSHD